MHFGNFSSGTAGAGKNRGYGFLSYIPALPGRTSKLGAGLEISQETFVVLMFQTDSKLYLTLCMEWSGPNRGFLHHPCPDNEGKGEQSLFLAAVASSLSLILKVHLGELKEAGGRAVACLGGGEKVGQAEKCVIIIINPLSGVCSSGKAGLCCAKYYLRL